MDGSNLCPLCRRHPAALTWPPRRYLRSVTGEVRVIGIAGALERWIGGGGLGKVETQLVFREKIFPFSFRFSLPTGRIYGEQSVITEWREDQALFGRMQLRIFSFAVGHPIRGAGRWKEEVRITRWL